MKQPKPIQVQGPGNIRIKLIVGGRSYIHLDAAQYSAYGCIEDRDIKRLHKWCEHILKRKGKKP